MSENLYMREYRAKQKLEKANANLNTESNREANHEANDTLASQLSVLTV